VEVIDAGGRERRRWDRVFAERCGAARGEFLARWGGSGRRSYLHPPSHWAALGDRRLTRLRYDQMRRRSALLLIESQTERLRARAAAGARVVRRDEGPLRGAGLLAAAGDDAAACFPRT